MDAPENDDNGGGDWTSRRKYPSSPNKHWDTLAEQRLDQLATEFRELRKGLDRIREQDLHAIREKQISDQNAANERGWAMKRIEERVTELISEQRGFQQTMAARLDNFVTKDEFNPYKSGMNKFVATVMVAVLMAVLGLVLIKGS